MSLNLTVHSILRYFKCIEDAEQAIRIDPKFTKGLRRKALALMAMGNIRVVLSFNTALLMF